MVSLRNEYIICDFDETSGRLLQIQREGLVLPFGGLAFDFGCDGKMATGILEYESMLEFRTWNLPAILPIRKNFLPARKNFLPIRKNFLPARKNFLPIRKDGLPSRMDFDLLPVRTVKGEDFFDVTYDLAGIQVIVHYELAGRCLRVGLSLTNFRKEALYLNGCAFVLSLEMIDGVTFDYPANTPIYHYQADKLKPFEVVQTGLINFATHTSLPGGDFNLLFLDDIEKWGCGTYRDESSTKYVYHAGLEADLGSGGSLEVGSLYLMPCAAAAGAFSGDGNPYVQIRDYVAGLGYAPCRNGIHDGVMYSCHPSGTMDANFPLKTDLYEYAEYLPVLKEMGIDHVWLLPVFDHNENGVYHSNDQSIIDQRYGGEEGCKYYCDKAHELGMTILFDYVPHGPAPEFPLAKDNPDWPSKRRDGSLQDEWECVSMDYNHPGYQEYTSQLVHDHVKRFGVDGARIDCAMGGLSNWRPYGGNRPSGNSVLAGVHITEAIRNGFLRGGKPSFILPENFNPLPNYYHCTDLFYGMNLYRAFVELEPLLAGNPSEYVNLLTDFLEREALVTPPDYHKMRFLGNHDTVSWVWQSARAADCYGTGAAKALFAVISLIDGVPMIYQGDEDPSIYGKDGENLTSYFAQLFGHRKAFLPKGSNATTYLHTGMPIMAFIREPLEEAARVVENPANGFYESKGDGRVLVLVNLSAEAQTFDFGTMQVELLAEGEADKKLSLGEVPAYGYKLFQVK